jgi:hypothetical protein
VTGPPILWHFPISHYNEKARWALDWKRIPHARRALGYVPRALWTTGQAKLPILLLGRRRSRARTQRIPDPRAPANLRSSQRNRATVLTLS